MKTKKLLLTAVCLAFAVTLVLALTACGGSCEHEWEYHDVGDGTRHNPFCVKCKNYGEAEPHTAGRCGDCEKCGYDGEHDYLAVPDGASEEHHKIVCSICENESEVVHELTDGYNSFKYSSYHVLDLRCWECNFAMQKIGEHTCADEKWQTSATAHWYECDECNEKYSYEIHDLKDGACTVCKYAAESLPVSENLVFTLSEDESYYILTEITRNDDDELDIIIPGTYEGKPVKAIGISNYGNFIGANGGIKALYIPDGVTFIGHSAFENSLDLVYVRLPDTLEVIEGHAFQNCQLVNITVPGSVKSLDSYAFADNKTLRSLVIGEGVQNLGDAFSGCYQLTSVSLPSTISIVTSGAFAYCDGIKSITIGQKDEESGEYPNSNSWYKVVDGCLIEKSTGKLMRASADMKIPAEVKVIGEYALSGDGKYYGIADEKTVRIDVVLPSKLERIDNGALSYKAVGMISFAGFNKTFAIEGNCLYEKATGTLLFGNESSVIPECVTSIASGAFENCTFGRFTLPSRIESMGEYAFSYCTFDELIIEDGVTMLGFSNCTTKQEVLVIPGSVKTVDNCAIKGMKKVELSEGVEELNAAFWMEISFPSTLKHVVADSYRYCETLTVYQGGKYLGDAKNPYLVLICIDQESFDGNIAVHQDTKIIANRAMFDMRESIESISLGNKLEYIGESAFYASEINADIVIPDSVKEIGDKAFGSVGGSYTLTLGEGIEKLGDEFVGRSGSVGDSWISYGRCYYLGTEKNPYMVLIEFDYYDLANPDNNNWVIHKDTKFIMESPESTDPDDTTFEGTCEEWGRVYKCDSFITSVNEYWETPKFTCSDGVVDLYGATYGLEFKKSSVDDSKYAVSRGTATGDIVIPAYYKGVPVVEIQLYGFSNPSITSVKLPETIVKIGEHSFATSSITEITIPDSVEIIDKDAFQSCPNLTEIKLGSGVKRVEPFAFSYCPELTSVILCDSLEYFSSYAVVDCPKLILNDYDNAYYLGTESNPYYALLKLTDNLVTSCEIHAETRMILDYAFRESNIVSVVVPDNVYTVERYAFNKCKSLKEVTLGKSVTKVEEYTFQMCTALTTVTFLGEVEELGDWSFSYCRELVNFALPDSLRIIGASVFAECNKLVFELGTNIEKISGNAFYSCFIDREDDVDYITFLGTAEEWNAIEKPDDWYVGSGAVRVVCSDSEISLA